MTQTPFDKLKTTCKKACHERQACEKGYKAMLTTTSVPLMMAVWRSNWQDIVSSKFADIINKELPAIYPSIKEGMNSAGIYLNECPPNANSSVLVLLTDNGNTVHIYNEAHAYVVGQATIVAHDHAQIYNYHGHAAVTLLDHAYACLPSTDTCTKSRFAKLTTVPEDSSSGITL